MKTEMLIVAFVVGVSACSNNSQSSITQKEKEQINEEIELVIKSILEGWINLDVNKAFKKSFATTDAFTYIGVDGSLMSYSEFFNTADKVFTSFKRAKLNLTKKKIYVVTKDVVIVSLNYSGTFYAAKSKLSFPNCGSTLILNKLENKWKVVHFHESVQESTFIESEIDSIKN